MQDDIAYSLSELSKLNDNKGLDFNTIFNSEDRVQDFDEFSSYTDYHHEASLFKNLQSQENVTALSSNIQSLPSKFQDLVNFVDVSNEHGCRFDIIALQEIWQLRDPLLFQIRDYNFFSSERQNCRGGGVGFYINQSFSVKKLNKVSKFKENIFESLVLEVSINSNKKLILANIYHPNNHKVLSNSEQLTTFF